MIESEGSAVDADDVNAQPYALGDGDDELRRLAVQARLLDPITRDLLLEGGLTDGMRVLDLGSGGGHVSFLAADIVGPSGEVVGVDRSAGAVRTATAVADRRNVSFQVVEPTGITVDRPFDAVVGRYVLQFQPDPVRTLREVTRHVRPGGLVIFHELDWSGIWSYPPSPAHDEAAAWAREAMRRSGMDLHMGLKLYPTFVAAGLRNPKVRMTSIIGGGPERIALLEHLANFVTTLAPTIVEFGLATMAQIDRDALLARMVDETRDSLVASRQQVGCWATT